jgi:hypothetical protein
VIIGLLSLFALADGAPVVQPPDPPPPDYQIVWPGNGVLERFRPDSTNEMRAFVTCTATPEQTLGDCKVTKTVPDTPPTGAAKIAASALRVAAQVKLKRPDGWKPGAQPESIDIVVHWPKH